LELLADPIAHLSSYLFPEYVLGDFNLDLLKYHENAFVQNDVDTFFASGFLQTIMKPTRCTSITATLIDHILAQCNNKELHSYILTSKISDHFPVFLTTENAKPRDPVKYLFVRDFSTKNVNSFKNDLSCIK